MSVSAALQFILTVNETLSTNVPFADAVAKNKEIIHNGLNFSTTLNATSTPPIASVAAFQKALVAGVATIDLRSLTGTNGIAIDGNSQKVQAGILHNPSTNANAITITVGSSNGYTLLGAGFSVTLSPGDRIPFYRPDTAPDIDGTHKNIDISGTGTQALNVLMLIG